MWILGETDRVHAVLHYENATGTEPPSPAPTTVTGTPLDEALLVPWDDTPVPGPRFLSDRFNWTFGGQNDPSLGWGFRVNGTRYTPPTVPTLLKILTGARNDTDFDPSENTRTIQRGDVVDIILRGGPPNHPIHLQSVSPSSHLCAFSRSSLPCVYDLVSERVVLFYSGHNFWVLQGATGGLNFDNPPKRDVTPTGGPFIAIRFIADNPG